MDRSPLKFKAKRERIPSVWSAVWLGTLTYTCVSVNFSLSLAYFSAHLLSILMCQVGKNSNTFALLILAGFYRLIYLVLYIKAFIFTHLMSETNL